MSSPNIPCGVIRSHAMSSSDISYPLLSYHIMSRDEIICLCHVMSSSTIVNEIITKLIILRISTVTNYRNIYFKNSRCNIISHLSSLVSFPISSALLLSHLLCSYLPSSLLSSLFSLLLCVVCCMWCVCVCWCVCVLRVLWVLLCVVVWRRREVEGEVQEEGRSKEAEQRQKKNNFEKKRQNFLKKGLHALAPEITPRVTT